MIKFDKRCKNRETRLCKCGCGITIASRNRNGEIYYVLGHQWKGKSRAGDKRNQKGKSNNAWKGGRVKKESIENSYMMVRAEGHPRAKGKGQYVKEHILVMEKHLGRYLKKEEVVHHINGIKYDNRIENLRLFNSNSEHSKFHNPKGVGFGGKNAIKKTMGN